MFMRRLSRRGAIALMATLLGATPVLSQSANFGRLSLAPSFPARAGQTTGNTAGSFSLSSIANRDRLNKPCIGFGDTNPDHIIVLQKNFPSLSVLVNSGGKDTTLVIQGPDKQTVRCGDDTGSSKDASVKDSNWAAGTYRIWVGNLEPGKRVNYTLTVRE